MSKQSKESLLFRFAFTLPSDTATSEEVKTWCKTHTKKWCFQEEKGANGFNHYQGSVVMKDKVRLATLINKGYFNKKIHWSVVHKGEASDFYATKEESRVSGPWSDKDVPRYIPSHMRNVILNRVQAKILKIIEEAKPSRDIFVIVDNQGNMGKSFLSCYLAIHENAIRIPLSAGDAQKMMEYAYSKVVQDPSKRRYIFIDLPRAQDPAKWGSIVRMVEQMKEGQFCDLRYTAKEVWAEQPIPVIFANKLPDDWADYASKDRWQYYDMHLIKDQCDQEEADELRQKDRGPTLKRARAMGPEELKAMEDEDDDDIVEVPATPQDTEPRTYTSEEIQELAAASDEFAYLEDFELPDIDDPVE